MEVMIYMRISMQDIKVAYQNIINQSERDKIQAYFWGLLIMIYNYNIEKELND